MVHTMAPFGFRVFGAKAWHVCKAEARLRQPWLKVSLCHTTRSCLVIIGCRFRVLVPAPPVKNAEKLGYTSLLDHFHVDPFMAYNAATNDLTRYGAAPY